MQRALQATRVLFGGELTGLSARDVLDIFSVVPSHDLPINLFGDEGLPLVDAIVSCGIATGRGAARKLIEGGGIYVNNRRVADSQATIARSELIEGKYLVLRKGAKNYHLARIV